MIPDIETVTRIMRETAAEEILPRFRHLSAADVFEKKPGDLVTAADYAAEARLSTALTNLVPGSRVVGEEMTDADPAILDSLSGEAPVWIVDPVDGTQNFADGKACFVVIVALYQNGETVAGWIHDPIEDTTAAAVAGQGAWIDGRRLRLPPPPPLGEMHGTLTRPLRNRLQGRAGPGPSHFVRYFCTGREYMDLALGKLHLGQYTRLKPWDHAAGVLLHREAGGVAGLTPDCTPYDPGLGIQSATLLMAPDRATWDFLHAAYADR
jgi:fructose-1,6-bisphosphatase/inositol monophosphatase family enzyme